MERKQANIRLGQTELDMLDTLRAFTKQTRSAFVRALIWAEWDRVEGNPQLKEAAARLIELRDELNSLTALLGGSPGDIDGNDGNA